MAGMASRNFTKHCFLATWIFDIRNFDYFEPAGQTVDNLRGRKPWIPFQTRRHPKTSEELLKSVFRPSQRIQERGRSLKRQMTTAPTSSMLTAIRLPKSANSSASRRVRSVGAQTYWRKAPAASRGSNPFLPLLSAFTSFQSDIQQVESEKVEEEFSRGVAILCAVSKRDPAHLDEAYIAFGAALLDTLE